MSPGHSYSETRHHTLRKSRLVMIDGRLTVNESSHGAGRSARVMQGGYWGFAARPADGTRRTGDGEDVLDAARRNAHAMARFGSRQDIVLPAQAHRGEHHHIGRPALTPAELLDRFGALNAWCRARWPALTSVRLMASDEEHAKHIGNSLGADAFCDIRRAQAYVILCADDERGTPIEVWERLSARGSFADLELDPETLAPRLDAAHIHLQNKRHAVPARGGLHTVVMAPALAGILAHEAMGHPCEADIVLGGAVTADLLGRPIASELVTMVDIAHSWGGAEAMMPVHVDDEGTPATDAVLIERGVLRGYMHSRETAARLDHAPTGSARAYGPADEPLVRMRNTVILPGTSKLGAMIEGVEDGYLLLETANGQADTTTEFMFGISLGYEIKAGRIGRAIRDTTLSGSAIKVLSSVDAVSDDMLWTATGYCGKKQTMVVSMGGPALRAKAQLGGE